MTDILSPSPYAYLDALPPAERQAEIARRQHSRREDWCDDARRARDYQSRIAELEAALEPFSKKADEFNDDETDDDLGSDGSGEQFLIGHFRRARAALRK